MSSKINIKGILDDHVKTLSDASSGKDSFLDVSVLFGLPIATAILLSFFNFEITVEFINILITSLSVLTGLLFNLLVLVYEVSTKEEEKLRKEVLRQTFCNISFTTLMSLFTVFALILPSIITNMDRSWISKLTAECLLTIYNIVIVTLVFSILMHLLLILKRVHILISSKK